MLAALIERSFSRTADETVLSTRVAIVDNPGMNRHQANRGYRFPPEIISPAVWPYHRFMLGFRDIEDLLAERGVIVTYESIRQWCMKLGPTYANQLRKRRGRLGDRWLMDEAVIVTVQGERRGVLWIKTITSSTFWSRYVKTNKPRSVSSVRC